MMKRIPLAAGLALAGLLVATTALAAEWQRQMHPTDCPGDADDLAWGAINEAFGANPDRLAYVCIDKYGAIRIVPLPWIRPGAGA